VGEIMAEVLPDGVFNTVIGGGDVGEMLASSTDIDVIAHVGSTATGQRLRRIAAETGAHVICENGGNDPLIVDADVDPQWAAELAALGSFANAGQICTSVERILVHRDIAEPFTAALASEAERINTERAIGPLVDDRMRESVHGHVSAALEAGARAV